MEAVSVLVLGGYGHFGARIVRALSTTPQLHVIAAGRHPDAAKAVFSSEVLARITLTRVEIQAPDLVAQLQATGAQLVVHTAGPFQGQGYEVALACLQADMHYIDLADGRDFVRDFAAQVDAAAHAAGRSAISGASTLPALSSAVVDALLPQFTALHEIATVIAPAQATPLGMATVRAVLSYCGQPFRWWCDARWQATRGWADPQPVAFARLAPRLASPCDVPDHDLLVQRYPGVRRVQFRAALELPFLQRSLALIAGVRGLGVPLPMANLAQVFARAGRWFDRFGTELGGMLVELRGTREGQAHALRWELTAPMLHGPEIPCFAAVLLVRRFARGEPLPVGAHACVGLISLAEFEQAFADWQIETTVTPA
ncbi:Saccharopine dehydrogenase, NADP-dependent [Pseudoxanthomonas sp. GM95]|uniref:saccharopine dehydrogenase family protein n=1 Tax=Pseudoxanthomonas sp. GM95 TaxID=1881043 RepID=UPI0008D53FC9|nr:saccharopine dehydrogenase NADP-binding domain-containing protein [Pseudoxanthomonas sp. GM95]SEM19837.1 Saccharopine dehydrogenase, NADP-dependent [Pseudoxanthomonas sp. GM95]